MSAERGWVTVFGSGRVAESEALYQQGIELGRSLAQKGFGVCTGGYGGIMAAAMRGAKLGGGRTAGAIIRGSSSKPNEWVETLYEEPTWAARLLKLIEVGSGYVVMDGGIGTLNELLMVWEMSNKNIHRKPIILLGNAVADWVATLKQNPWVEGSDKPFKAASAMDAVDYLDETL